MKKLLSLILALSLLLTAASALAEGGTPPAPPSGEMSGGTPPERPDGDQGTPPDGMGTPPSGAPGGMGGMGGPGGQSSFSGEYTAVVTVDSDTALTEDIASTGTDENALLVTGGQSTLSGATVTRYSDDSTGGDNASFYGVGAAILATDGTLTVTDAVIDTDAAGGAGVFSYGDAVVYISDSTITTQQSTSGGIHVAGGGTLYAKNLTVTTQGGSAAAIRSDRGSGIMVVDGGTYTSNGSGSPAVYVTADISIRGAELTATGSEALCLEGLNSVALYDCVLTGDMPDQAQNDNTWTVILYQSMSGDSQVGQGSFVMDGGSLVSLNGGLFYTTNTESVFTLRGVEIQASEDCEYFLRCTGNQNARGWGSTGSNGAQCVFTALSQAMTGDVIWDSISTLDLYIAQGSIFTGAVIDDESCAGSGGSGTCRVVIDETSTWIVTGDSVLTALENAGTIVDDNGQAVTIQTADGAVLVSGDSAYTITVASYAETANLSGMGEVGAFTEVM